MTVPQITPPPLLPAPPFTSPVEVEGKLYIAQETFGAANKHVTNDEALLVGCTHACLGFEESLVAVGKTRRE